MFLVSENTTSYGKDLGDLQLMEKILPEIAALPGIERVRLSYLQPARQTVDSSLHQLVVMEHLVRGKVVAHTHR